MISPFARPGRDGIEEMKHMGDPVTDYVTYLALLGRSPRTIVHYRNTLVRLRDWLGETDLLDATEDHLTAWRSELSLSPSSVRQYVAAAAGFYRWAARAHLVVDDPTLTIPRPSVGRRLPRPIADDALEHAIDTACERVRPWLVLAGYAGLRCIEIARLRRTDVHENAEAPYLIVHGKRDKERHVPMSAYVWAEIRTRMAHKGWAFPRRDGRYGHIPPATISRLGNAHLKACGLHETMHQLRHRFGTAAYAVDRDLRIVQELMGHQSPSSTAIYAAFSNPDAVRAVNGIQPGGRRLRPVRDQ